MSSTTHNHSHDHGSGGHHHLPTRFGKAFAIGILLNFGFVIVEASYGYFSNSLALMADAGHNLSDVLGLALAWFAIWLGTKKPSHEYTYGLGQTSILAAFFNSLFLLFVVSGIIWQAIFRLQNPEPVVGNTVIYVASVGIFINAFTAFMFMSGGKSDLNIRGAYLHMAADAVVSAGVVIAGVVMQNTGWLWLDPLASIVIGVVIVFSTWRLLRDSFKLAVAAVPSTVQHHKVRHHLGTQNGVSAVHDLHLWAMSTTENALTAHLVMRGGHPGDLFLRNISHELECKFQIHHTTLQIEIGDDNGRCALESDDVV